MSGDILAVVDLFYSDVLYKPTALKLKRGRLAGNEFFRKGWRGFSKNTLQDNT